MKSKWPKKIVAKIGYMPYNIEFEPISLNGKKRCMGWTENREGQMAIGTGQGPDEQIRNTILHEVLHAVIYCYGMKSMFKDKDQEEQIVNAMANGLQDTLNNNPKLRKLIFE